MRVSIYFSQFQLNVRYRFDKRHVLFDVLSRLSIDRFFLNDEKNLNLKTYYVNMKFCFVLTINNV